MAFFPRIALSPPRKGEYRGRDDGCPSRSPSSPFSPTGSCPVRESVPCELAVKRFHRSIPSWALSSRRSSRSRSRRIFTSATLVLHRFQLRQVTLRLPIAPVCGCTPACLASRTAPLSLENGQPFRGFPPSAPHPCRVTRLWLIALRLSPRDPGDVAVP